MPWRSCPTFARFPHRDKAIANSTSMKSVDASASSQAVQSSNDAEFAVNLRGIVARYRGQTVLHDVSLHIRNGEFLTLMGPSGCGKTTLLDLIAGVTHADQGEIIIDGQLVTALPSPQRHIGVVLQNDSPFPDAGVAETIGHALCRRDAAAEEIAERVDAVMHLVKLDGLGHRQPSALSGAQQQRLALARALVIRPKVLLLDEPFSALDQGLGEAMQGEILQIQRQLGITTVLATRDRDAALRMSDRIAVMSAGRILQIDAPDAIYRRPSDPAVAAFLGDVNVLTAHFHGQDSRHIHLRMGAGFVSIERGRLVGAQHDGGRMNVYVRPEHIRFEPLSDAAVLTGTVVQHVCHGDHVDSYVDVNGAAGASQRVIVRSVGQGATEHFPIGTVTALTLPPRHMTVYPEA